MKPRLSDHEFDALKRRRDDNVEAVVKRICEDMGWPLDQIHTHASHAGDCYCACPNGPCQHLWDGPIHEEETMHSVTCSRCGAIAAYHDMRVAP